MESCMFDEKLSLTRGARSQLTGASENKFKNHFENL